MKVEVDAYEVRFAVEGLGLVINENTKGGW